MRPALLAALVSLALPARGLDFGEPQVLSTLGEKLDARIPLKAAPGEWFHATCLALSPGPGATALPPLSEGTVSVERRSRSANLRVRSAVPVHEPAVAFAVTSRCAGAAHEVRREFSVLLDLPPASRTSSKAPPARGPSPVAAMTARVPAPASPAARAPSAAQAVQTPNPPAPTRERDTSFVLRLTSDPIDISRSRGFDEKSRAALRERLRLLDSDDQVAAVLALRDNMQRLEARVAELQLKLSAVPTSTAPKGAPSSQAAQEPEAAPAPAPAPVAKAMPTPAPKAAPAPPAAEEDWIGGPWAWLGGLGILGLLLAYWGWTRRASTRAAATQEPQDDAATVFMPMAPNTDADEPPIEIAVPVQAVTAAARPYPLEPEPERAADPVQALRRRYVEERFPEVASRTIVLDDPGSVVKGARLFYQDGAMPRAVELLRFAIEDRPEEIRPWLALFEIYRLEHLAGEYGELAARFRERHEANPKWEKVRAFGREIDPGNPAYDEPPVESLETIGPREARRRAAPHADPIAENWLEAPMDFENEVLATELRRALMARARVDERDLAPNPIPALRSVEMFSAG